MSSIQPPSSNAHCRRVSHAGWASALTLIEGGWITDLIGWSGALAAWLVQTRLAKAVDKERLASR